jgi:glycosyltransferase involved in cell wall biosynthesis
MVLQEAGAMACPVITTAVPGASEVLQDGVSCLLCEPRDATSLAQAMATLCDDRMRCRAMGEAARAYVEQRYERGLMLDNQMKRYEELLGEEVLVCN